MAIETLNTTSRSSLVETVVMRPDGTVQGKHVYANAHFTDPYRRGKTSDVRLKFHEDQILKAEKIRNEPDQQERDKVKVKNSELKKTLEDPAKKFLFFCNEIDDCYNTDMLLKICALFETELKNKNGKYKYHEHLFKRLRAWGEKDPRFCRFVYKLNDLKELQQDDHEVAAFLDVLVEHKKEHRETIDFLIVYGEFDYNCELLLSGDASNYGANLAQVYSFLKAINDPKLVNQIDARVKNPNNTWLYQQSSLLEENKKLQKVLNNRPWISRIRFWESPEKQFIKKVITGLKEKKTSFDTNYNKIIEIKSGLFQEIERFDRNTLLLLIRTNLSLKAAFFKEFNLTHRSKPLELRTAMRNIFPQLAFEIPEMAKIMLQANLDDVLKEHFPSLNIEEPSNPPAAPTDASEPAQDNVLSATPVEPELSVVQRPSTQLIRHNSTLIEGANELKKLKSLGSPIGSPSLLIQMFNTVSSLRKMFKEVALGKVFNVSQTISKLSQPSSKQSFGSVKKVIADSSFEKDSVVTKKEIKSAVSGYSQIAMAISSEQNVAVTPEPELEKNEVQNPLHKEPELIESYPTVNEDVHLNEQSKELPTDADASYVDDEVTHVLNENKDEALQSEIEVTSPASGRRDEITSVSSLEDEFVAAVEELSQSPTVIAVGSVQNAAVTPEPELEETEVQNPLHKVELIESYPTINEENHLNEQSEELLTGADDEVTHVLNGDEDRAVQSEIETTSQVSEKGDEITAISGLEDKFVAAVEEPSQSPTVMAVGSEQNAAVTSEPELEETEDVHLNEQSEELPTDADDEVTHVLNGDEDRAVQSEIETTSQVSEKGDEITAFSGLKNEFVAAVEELKTTLERVIASDPGLTHYFELSNRVDSLFANVRIDTDADDEVTHTLIGDENRALQSEIETTPQVSEKRDEITTTSGSENGSAVAAEEVSDSTVQLPAAMTKILDLVYDELNLSYPGNVDMADLFGDRSTDRRVDTDADDEAAHSLAGNQQGSIVASIAEDNVSEVQSQEVDLAEQSEQKEHEFKDAESNSKDGFGFGSHGFFGNNGQMKRSDSFSVTGPEKEIAPSVSTNAEGFDIPRLTAEYLKRNHDNKSSKSKGSSMGSSMDRFLKDTPKQPEPKNLVENDSNSVVRSIGHESDMDSVVSSIGPGDTDSDSAIQSINGSEESQSSRGNGIR